MTRKLIDDCFVNDAGRMRHTDAVALMRSRVAPVAEIVRVPLAEACGRTLAKSVIAGIAVPAHTNAAVDGYSFAAIDAPEAAKDGLPVAARAAAGHALIDVPPAHSAVRIFTGAVLPAGHDTVAMQEDCDRVDIDGRGLVRIPAGLKRSANVRPVGEDVGVGQTLLERGVVLRPQDIAALASVGCAEVDIYARLRVAILSSGDEVVQPGQPLAPGQVYDANAPMLRGLIGNSGAEVSVIGGVGDTAAALQSALAAAARDFDVVVTSGGASQGEEDHLGSSVAALGKRHLWQIAIKPGRPMLFGQIGDCVVVGLPGNPVAVFVCFLMYVWPLLRRLGGAPWQEPRRWRVPAKFSVPKRKAGRREFWRGMIVDTADGLAVQKFAADGSGLISGLRAADGLIEIGEEVTAVGVGDLVDFIPSTEFGIAARTY